MIPLVVDRKTAAEALGVSLWTLDTWIAEGRIPTVRLPSTRHAGERCRRVLISTDDLKAFVERQRVAS